MIDKFIKKIDNFNIDYLNSIATLDIRVSPYFTVTCFKRRYLKTYFLLIGYSLRLGLPLQQFKIASKHILQRQKIIQDPNFFMSIIH